MADVFITNEKEPARSSAFIPAEVIDSDAESGLNNFVPKSQNFENLNSWFKDCIPSCFPTLFQME